MRVGRIRWTKDDGRYGHLATFLVDTMVQSDVPDSGPIFRQKKRTSVTDVTCAVRPESDIKFAFCLC